MRPIKTRYYRETERTIKFADGTHYHTDDAVWVVEPIGNRSYRRATITYFDYCAIDARNGNVTTARYTETHRFRCEHLRNRIKEMHLVEITKAEAFKLLL